MKQGKVNKKVNCIISMGGWLDAHLPLIIKQVAALIAWETAGQCRLNAESRSHRLEIKLMWWWATWDILHFKIELSNPQKVHIVWWSSGIFHPKSTVHKQILLSQIMNMNNNVPSANTIQISDWIKPVDCHEIADHVYSTLPYKRSDAAPHSHPPRWQIFLEIGIWLLDL